MKKLILATCAILLTSFVFSQYDFKTEFDKVFETDTKLINLIKKLQNNFSSSQLSDILIADKLPEVHSSFVLTENKLLELKNQFIEAKEVRSIFFKRMYGSEMRINVADFQERLSRYFDIKVLTNPGCACRLGCYIGNALCRQNCDSEYCHGQCDASLIECLSKCAPCGGD